MKNILNPKQIEEATVKVTCGDDQGTGFFIDSNKILIAYHVVMENVSNKETIKVELYDHDLKEGELLSINENFDICILLIKIESFVAKTYLPLQPSIIKYNENWETFGFPYKIESDGIRLEGRVNQITVDKRWDFLLSCKDIDRNFSYEGLSGSCVIIDGNVGGVILKQVDEKLAAISIEKILPFLEQNKIEINEPLNQLDIPEQLKEQIKNSTPNYSVFENIEEAIKNSSNWLLISGSPGSGKTVIAASFESDNNSISIIGRYFIKIPNDSLSLAIRISKEFLLQWFEDLICIIITGLPSAKNNLSFNDRLKRLSIFLGDLSDFLNNNKKNGVFIIDGLDEVPDLNSFLNIIPVKLPNNISILLSCTSKEILPSFLKNGLEDAHIIVVTPIDIGQCEAFIIKELGKEKLTIDNVQGLALKSEGHPLYLRYLINYVKTQNIEDYEINNWINNIPPIGGDILKYYNTIWDKTYSTADKLWILIILAQLRQPISIGSLIKMLPPNFQTSFYSNFKTLQYLFKKSESIEIYHDSFKNFINAKVTGNLLYANDLIVEFCESNSNNEYSINNLMYHYTLSSNSRNSFEKCDQKWADKCALEHVHPDLVISDIRNVINISIAESETTQLIRLLLLLQRIEFRYDSIFANYATDIASALIALDRPKDALKYLIRDNTLLISNNEAIMFLQLLYENDSLKEANILFGAIEARFRKLINDGSKSKKGIEIQTFIMPLQAYTLYMNENRKKGHNKFVRLFGFLSNQRDYAVETNDTLRLEAINSIREFCASWMNAYAIRRFDFFINTEQTSEREKIQIDETWAKFRAMTIINYHDINNYSSSHYIKNSKYFEAIKDIEYLVGNYGFTNNENDLFILISALIHDSKKTEILIVLINKYLENNFQFRLREKNGVDLNKKNIQFYYFRFKCLGYIDQNDQYPEENSNSYDNDWEKFIATLIKQIAFLEGSAYRLKSENKLENIHLIFDKYLEFLKKIEFTLYERISWDRSYQLPESIFPFVYSKIILFYLVFKKDSIDNFIESIIKRCNNQLGLYTEGFRNSLCVIIKELVIYEDQKSNVLKLLEVWEAHVVEGVQNRWERTSDLLRIIEFFGIVGDKEKAERVFQEMLDTSMGPSWYKEEQLLLINTAISIKSDNNVINKFIKDFAALLDFASGEMTFQRYVRNDKENFIGSLIKQNNFSKAIEYFKFEILPPLKVLIQSAEHFTTDAPKIGIGYALGARNICEQNGILKILENTKEINPFLRWGLCEVFLVNDDTWRTIGDFSNHQAKSLNELEEQQQQLEVLDEMCKSLATQILSKELEIDKEEYLSSLKNNLSESNIKKLQGYLLKDDYLWEIDDNKKDIKTKIYENEMLNSFSTFNDNFENSNYKKHEELIIEGIKAFRDERVNIWYPNWSAGSVLAKNNLKKLFKTDNNVVKYLSESINKFYTSSWLVVDSLIWFLDDKLSENKIEEIHKYVAEHFYFLIRPDEYSYSKYIWLEHNSTNSNTIDYELINLLIWLLNHPVKRINQKVSKVLLWLSSVHPELIIPQLIIESTTENPFISTEICSLILKELSILEPKKLIDCIEKNPSLINRIINLTHFSIKKNFIDISLNLNQNGHHELYKQLNLSLLNPIIYEGRVDFEEDFLNNFNYKTIKQLETLNSLQILNKKFCDELLKKIHEFSELTSQGDFIKYDIYLKRSFNNELNYISKFFYILKYSLNIAINSRIDKLNMEEIYKLLN